MRGTEDLTEEEFEEEILKHDILLHMIREAQSLSAALGLAVIFSAKTEKPVFAETLYRTVLRIVQDG